MIDLMTFEQGKFNKTLLGTYYNSKRITEQNTGVPFDYEIIDPRSKAQETIGTNLSVNQYQRATVKTNDPLEWKVGHYVALQGGGLYQIEEVREDIGEISRENYRDFNFNFGTNYVLRLVEIANPEALK